MIKKLNIKAIIFIILLAFASYGYTQTNLIVSFYNSGVVNPIIPDGCGVQLQKGIWHSSMKVVRNMYFGSAFDFYLSREFGKVLGKIGLCNSFNGRLRFSGCGFKTFFPDIGDYDKDQLFDMIGLSAFGHTLNVFKYFYTDISLNPGIVFDLYGHGSVNTYLIAPMKIYAYIGNFAAGLTFDILFYPTVNYFGEIWDAQVYLGYQFEIFEKSRH
ncbi:hypothetical protein KKC74_15375 [bacterium]|nr:hypothetical protein [bacterium]MBU1066168.1 hypothetical protein [bacterium]MBU1873457.1 hypothetical protein [bacterium]